MTDKTYSEAAMTTLGHNIADIWRGLLEGGMSRKEALVVICAYMRGLAANKAEPEDGEA